MEYAVHSFQAMSKGVETELLFQIVLTHGFRLFRHSSRRNRSDDSEQDKKTDLHHGEKKPIEYSIVLNEMVYSKDVRIRTDDHRNEHGLL